MKKECAPCIMGFPFFLSLNILFIVTKKKENELVFSIINVWMYFEKLGNEVATLNFHVFIGCLLFLNGFIILFCCGFCVVV